MDEILYLEADEEITSVIDKLKGLETDSIGLVAPKGSTIVQSVVSLKLLKKEAEKQKKQIALITSDEVGRNLAGQVGILTYADVKSQTPIANSGDKEIDELKKPLEIDMSKKVDEKSSIAPAVSAVSTAQEEPLPEGVNVHRYDEDKDEQTEEEKDDFVSGKKEKEEKAPEHFVKRSVVEQVPHQDREEIESARPIKYGDHKPVAKPVKKYKKPLIISLVSIGVIAALFAADIALTKMSVNLIVDAEPIQKDAQVTVEKDRGTVDLEKSLIPGTQIQKEGEVNGTYNATGTKNAGDKAKGTLTFKNNDGGPQTINAGTTVRSSSGVSFVLDSTITVPGATVNMGQITLGKTDGAVTAEDPGSNGNMPSSTTYSVTGKASLTAEGGTSGGVTKKIQIVTQTDIDNARSDLEAKQLPDVLTDADKAKGLMILDGSGRTELSGFSTSKNEGDEASSFTAKANAKYTAIAFKMQDLKDVAVKSIEKNLPEGKGLLQTDTDTFTSTVKDSQINVGKLVLNVNLKSHIGPKIDLTNLKTTWRFKPLKTINNSLSVPGITVEGIDISPSFVLPLGPVLTRNTNINLEYKSK